MERFAGALKRVLLQAGSNAAADQAMRVQLAARSNDLKRAASAIAKLRIALQDEQASAAEAYGTFAPCPSRGES